jgi:chromosome segregation ATPase
LRIALAEAEEESSALRSQYAQLRDLLKKSTDEAKSTSQELKDAKEKEQQLERVIQFLRKRTEESHLGLNDLDGQFQKTQTTLKGVSEDLEKARREIQDLNQALDEERHQKLQLEKALHQLQSEHERLRSSTLSEQQINFANELRERDASIDSLRNELDRFRQKALKEIQSAHEELQHKELVLKETFEAKQQSLEIKERDYLQQIHFLQEEKQLLQSQLEEAGQAVHDKRLLEESFSKLQLEFQHLSHRLQEVSAHAKNQSDDLEARLRLAQQHLAKRVREATLLNEKNEEQRAKLLEYQTLLAESKIKITELQNTLEVELQHNKRWQEKTQESTQHLETQLAKWEKKYFQLHERWQENEERIRTLLRIEDKYNQMQSLLVQLGALADNPLLFNAVQPIKEPPKRADEPSVVENIDADPAQNDLFQPAPKPANYRNSLFE